MDAQVTLEFTDEQAARLQAIAAYEGVALQGLMMKIVDDLLREYDRKMAAIEEGRLSAATEPHLSLDEVERNLAAHMDTRDRGRRVA